MVKKTVVAIGGGEIKNKTTLEIDGYIADLAKARAGERRANALFIGTASHDFMPYFNSFRKTYTSVYDIKADVLQTVFRQTEPARMREKLDKADAIYIGGGDTKFMIDSWRQSGVDVLIKEAYDRGVIIAGLSAGAICWFEEMYTDSEIISGEGNDYKVMPALGWFKGLACPHYNERQRDFDEILLREKRSALAIENDCAVVFENGEIVRTVSTGGKAFTIECKDGALVRTEL